MKVFVGGKLYDSRRDVIGVVLSAKDRENIAAMHPEATVYAEFTPEGKAEIEGCREFSVECVERLLDDVKRRAAERDDEIARAPRKARP